LNDIIRNNVPAEVQTDTHHILFKPKITPNTQKSFSNEPASSKQEVYLASAYELMILEHGKKSYARQQGLIISAHAYFSGEFESGAIHGPGICLFLSEDNQSVRSTVKGRWKSNVPTELSIYNQQAVQPLLSIVFIDGEQMAKITLPDRTTYLGSIRFAQARSVQQIMTGKGVVNFSNKDIYIGEVRDGLMHTSQNSPGRFISRSHSINYLGHYANGYRDGEGLMSVDVEGKTLGVRCLWRAGAMAGQFTVE
jgi:hypothetical protein